MIKTLFDKSPNALGSGYDVGSGIKIPLGISWAS